MGGMGFQWGWSKRVPGKVGGGGMIVLGFFAAIYGFTLIFFIVAYLIAICSWVYDILAGLVGKL